VLPAVLPPDAGLSLSLALPALVWAAGGVVACTTVAVDDIARVEFFLVAVPDAVPEFFLERVLEPPTDMLPEPRFRFLITSVFKLRGLTTPWSFRNRPQALHRGWPSGLRRHRGVVCVKQFVQVVGAVLSPWFVPDPLWRFVLEPCLEPGGGEDGLLCATDEKPDGWPASSAGGEFGFDWAR
jgi:hypothetical protein